MITHVLDSQINLKISMYFINLIGLVLTVYPITDKP